MDTANWYSKCLEFNDKSFIKIISLKIRTLKGKVGLSQINNKKIDKNEIKRSRDTDPVRYR